MDLTMRDLRISTRAVRAGLPAGSQGEPFLPGPVFAAPFHLVGDPAGSPYVYGRYGNPTWTLFENAVAELEGGPAAVFSSGMAAITALMSTCLRAGDVLVMPSDTYGGSRTLAAEQLEGSGIEVRRAPTAGPGLAELIDGATLLWLETPTNPGLDVCDIEELSRLAHAAGALVAVDNTSATPLLQRPLELGADYSVTSATKQLSGHSDLLLGYVAAREPEAAERLRAWRTMTGSIAGPFETWLAHRSLATLDIRLERQCRNASLLAEALIARPDVDGVRYPGLLDDPSHGLAARQMSNFGTVVGFSLETRERAERFLASCRIITEATSFGGLHSSAERRGRWGLEEVGEGFIRLSAGCEHADDLLTDVTKALDASESEPPPA